MKGSVYRYYEGTHVNIFLWFYLRSLVVRLTSRELEMGQGISGKVMTTHTSIVFTFSMTV